MSSSSSRCDGALQIPNVPKATYCSRILWFFTRLHTDTFVDFLQKAISGLRLVHEIVELAYVERIGLRYLDAVAPMEDDTLATIPEPISAGLNCES